MIGCTAEGLLQLWDIAQAKPTQILPIKIDSSARWHSKVLVINEEFIFHWNTNTKNADLYDVKNDKHYTLSEVSNAYVLNDDELLLNRNAILNLKTMEISKMGDNFRLGLIDHIINVNSNYFNSSGEYTKSIEIIPGLNSIGSLLALLAQQKSGK